VGDGEVLMRWFGKTWHASVCSDPAEHVPTPIGEACLLCEIPVRENEQGVVQPHVFGTPEDFTVRLAPIHIRCLIRASRGFRFQRVSR
jgi:hypothetical protein